ncbi:hypothetical protein BB8028_0006g02500 [Beauveria bassiana]|uniref:Uncharacterized protein n=1 Tax=Beauveria bassiana TaxID=176275 RepID=A0A2S7YIB9_BEABA|nr:hypothetical protein BB8028_0006g02500 [Beauveria bassiana]
MRCISRLRTSQDHSNLCHIHYSRPVSSILECPSSRDMHRMRPPPFEEKDTTRKNHSGSLTWYQKISLYPLLVPRSCGARCVCHEVSRLAPHQLVAQPPPAPRNEREEVLVSPSPSAFLPFVVIELMSWNLRRETTSWNLGLYAGALGSRFVMSGKNSSSWVSSHRIWLQENKHVPVSRRCMSF